MLAGTEREALMRVPDRLSIELGYSGDEVPAASSALGGDGGRMSGMLDSEDELLVETVRGGLAKIVAAVGGFDPEDESARAVSAALDGAEMVMRGELVRGNGGSLPALLPSFVFLVTLSVSEQDTALDLSRRTAELVEQALAT